MKRFYKLCVLLFAGLLVFIGGFSDATRSKFWGWNSTTAPTVEDPIVGGENVENIAQGTYKATNDKLQGILRFPPRDQYSTTLGYAIRLVQVSINWILGILAFVALVYMLYCGFLVFSSGTEDKNTQKGRKGISTAAIALAGIGLSWLIVSAMIWFITILTEVK